MRKCVNRLLHMEPADESLWATASSFRSYSTSGVRGDVELDLIMGNAL